jgi:hypothetical protein
VLGFCLKLHLLGAVNSILQTATGMAILDATDADRVLHIYQHFERSIPTGSGWE